jgi:two-component system CheB/CheR fusion protein
VLIIDDERPVADATKLLLELEGFTVALASSGQEALDRVREEAPDVIVSDFHLRGGETGASVVATVRGELGNNVPVVFITGDTSGTTRSTSGVENARLLSKPVHADDLIAALRSQLGNRS